MTTKKNFLTLLGIALVVTIIATGLFYGLVVGKLSDEVVAPADLVVVARHDLTPGTQLVAADVQAVARTGEDALVAGFSSPSDVTGLVVTRPVAAGAVVAREALASKSSSHGAAFGVPAGMRAVSVHVADSTGVVRLLQPGHRVDAQFVEGGGGQTRLRTALQNLEVLRVEAEPEMSQNRPLLPVVTLLATPEEADALAVADATARIRLLLRHPLDGEITDRGAVALSRVFNNPPRQESRDPAVSRTASGRDRESETPGVETVSARR